ncbi:hypothetical protein VTJ49DRAFT_1448 [Mycothermus thermophilus]|uniref:Uncharacterized protein n=1 Tax=Humicola insolens TaxID=85995 RepID=A0ABR3VCH6_HUMIN
MASASTFVGPNHGIEVGQNYASITAAFHLPPEPPPKPFALLPSNDPDFVSRQDILDQIAERCSRPRTHCRVVLVGLGGIGKSRIAIEYGHRVAAANPDNPQWIFWVNAGTRARVLEGFEAIAEAIKLPARHERGANIPRLVHTWLSNPNNGHWVMILDGVDTLDVFYTPTGSDGAYSGGSDSDGSDSGPLSRYLPQSDHGSIFITTRTKDVARKMIGHDPRNTIEVGPLPEAEALDLLERKLAGLPEPTDADVARDLARALNGVPLAITQAVAYIQSRVPRMSPEKYLERFREGEQERNELLEHDEGDWQREAASNAIFVTWKISFDHIRDKQPSAADLLSLMSFFDPQSIPEFALKPPPVPENTQTTDNIHNTADQPPTKINSSVNVLQDSLGKEHAAYLSLTRALQEAFRMQHRFCEAEDLAKFAINAYKAKLGPRHLKLLQRLDDLADIYRDWGRMEESEKVIRRVLHVRTSTFGTNHRGTLKTKIRLAELRRDQGQLIEAWRLFTESLAALESRFGKDDEETWDCMQHLAETCCGLGYWKEAEVMYTRLRTAMESQLGKTHWDTLDCVAGIAKLRRLQGRYKEAEEIFRWLVEASSHTWLRPHFQLSLAQVMHDQGRFEEAVTLAEEVASWSERELGPDDRLTQHARERIIKLGGTRNTSGDPGSQTDSQEAPGQPSTAMVPE